MRHKRQKAYKKLLSFYALHYNFRSPLQILLTPSFVQSAYHAQYDLTSLLKKMVQDEVRILISQCAMQEIYNMKDQKLVEEAQKYERRRCGHIPPDTESTEVCTLELIGKENKFRYILASNGERIRDKARQVPGVPILHFNSRSVIVFENPSEGTKAVVEAKQQQAARAEDSQPQVRAIPSARLKRKHTNPNPLAVKKRKTKADFVALEAQKRRRRRERDMLGKVISQHEE